MLRLNPSGKIELDEHDSLNVNSILTPPKTILGIFIKVYVDSLSGNDRKRRVFCKVFDDQDDELEDDKLRNLYSFSVIRDPISDKELANKK